MESNMPPEGPQLPYRKTSPKPKVGPSSKLKASIKPSNEPSPPAPIGPYSHKQFSSVRRAKEALREKALDLLEEFRQTIIEARAAGKYEEALKAYQWLLDHIPSDEGERMLEASVDKTSNQESGNKGPIVNIGFKIGGTSEVKALPEPFIDVKSE